ncbi:YfiT family bacillithiol transferase [Cohnella nanjingensis]|uniref:Putative metal-dependent hydrolase n=1 Tax=Cohnella nanjingensis TaxID=1387779 RepID=A0A7X0RWY9_9BACL|nr:putative metal-dependent hydrolase [Cohnella nanjingensis]MBB6675192.1 putative metal-dependent hydrolase [Cohnella nanjingensis]
MDPLSHPIGTFRPEENPTSARRAAWIAEIAALPGRLRSAVGHLATGQLETPYRPGGWTVRQVVHHLADNDMNAYIRFKRALTEEAPLASSYREDLWAELDDYRDTPIENSLVLLATLRERFVILLRSRSPHEFRRAFTSPAHGEMTLDHALQRYDWHGRHHLAQIQSLAARMGWT